MSFSAGAAPLLPAAGWAAGAHPGRHILPSSCSPILLHEQFSPHISHPLASEVSPGLDRWEEVLLCVAAADRAPWQPLDTFHLHSC